MKLLFLTLLSISLSRASFYLGKALDSKVFIDPDKKYALGWLVDLPKNEVVFEVEVETRGYVGFGISPSGSMVGADIFIAGVKDGAAYFGDYHGNRNGQPVEDSEVNWNLISSGENETHTILRFSRLLNTCDDQDYPIGEDTNRLIWAIGETDEIVRHAQRGAYSANILLPDDPFDGEGFKVHYTIANSTMPKEDTSYWCTIHEGPFLDKKHHIISFQPFLPSPESVAHTHHLVLHKCIAPTGQDPEAVFGKFINDPGNHCFATEHQHLPTQYCQTEMFIWAKGGKGMVFPENIGYPIGDRPGVKQYYMMEIHYDNPDELDGLHFETGVKSYFTEELREHEANIMVVAAKLNPSFMVPPETDNFIVAGHCPSVCTKVFFPKEGVTVFNTLLHAHLSGRKLRIRQFRNGTELPWLDFDDHYDFNYQQNKAVTERKILPGDQLTFECTYSSSWKGGEAVIGGFSTREEMCDGYMWHWPSNGLELCMSGYPVQDGMEELGVTKYRKLDSGNGIADQYYIDEPEELEGNYLESISYKINWTESLKKDLQEKRRFGTHQFDCGAWSDPEELWVSGKVKYVEAEEYVPVDVCVEKVEQNK